MVTDNYPKTTVVSVVSHGQQHLVAQLLSDIDRYWNTRDVSVILTINIPEELEFSETHFTFPLLVVRNDEPKGFGANHNAAFDLSSADMFCVLNPDIRATRDPLPRLRKRLANNQRLGLVAPKIMNPEGGIEDSARRALTPTRLLRRVILRKRGPEYTVASSKNIYPDWVAGMFMLVRSRDFANVGGFNERYFMYCEDADLCLRLWFAGRGVSLVGATRVVHAAHRASHGSLKHLMWHISSMVRFFRTFRRPRHAN